jgi:hypothetical protein
MLKNIVIRGRRKSDPAITIAKVSAYMMVGDAEKNGSRELALNAEEGHIVWNQDGDGYLDTNELPFRLSIIKARAVLFVAGERKEIAITNAQIKAVELRARCDVPKDKSAPVGSVSAMLTRASITFFDNDGNGVGVDAGKIGSLPSAVLPPGATMAVEDGFMFEPPGDNYQRLEINGRFRLQSMDPARRYPGSTPPLEPKQAIIGVHVYTA